MAEPNKSAVPKFSSFKPKSIAAAKEAQSYSNPPTKEDRPKDRKRDKHEDRRRHTSSKEHRRGKERHHVQTPSSKPTIEKVETLDLAIRTDDDDRLGYRIDVDGDIANLKYGSLHRYSIPVYRRIGHGSVLGVDTRAKIDRVLSDEKGIVVDAPESSRRQSRRLLLKSNASDGRSLRLVRPSVETQRLDYDKDFVSLLPSKKKKKKKHGSQSPISEHGEVDYRSIEGKAKQSNEPIDPDLEFLTDSSTGNEMSTELEASARRTNAEISRRTRQEPQNLSAWLELINHQTLLLGINPNQILSSPEQRSLAEMKLSIYEQALKAIGMDVESRTTLQLGLLEEGVKVWETSKVIDKWKETYHANSRNPRICVAYINFIQASFFGFDFERCKVTYMECLQTLTTALTEPIAAPESIERTSAAVYIFLRLSVLMCSAGYHEHAEALWQGVLELHFSRPRSLQSDNEILPSFEEFWESEVPRIGELDSKGWERFLPGAQDIPEPLSIISRTVDDDDHIFKQFATAEKETASILSHAGRSSDETGENDPYHMVLFNDVRPFLFPAMLRLSSARDLLPAFLLFLRLPPLPYSEDRTFENWWLDPFLATPTVNKALGLDAPIINREITSDVLFSDAFDKVQLADPSWVRRGLQRLVDVLPENDLLAEYFIAFEFCFFSSSAAQSAKRLLKARPHSLRLYNCYGIIQCRMKGQSAGSRIFVTAISMTSSLGAVEQNLVILLWRTWIFEAIRTDQIPEFVRRLLSVGTSSPTADGTDNGAMPEFSPATVLRAKRFLTEGRDGMLSTSRDHLAVMYVELLALLTYFQTSNSLEAGLEIYAEASQMFGKRGKERSPGHEHLHQAKMQLLVLHHKHTTLFKPSVIRECLMESIAMFPNNTIFLAAYSDNEKRFRIDDRVRAVLSDVVLQEKSDTVAGWTFAIWSEMQRGLEFGGTSYTVRAVFEKSLQRSGKHNIGLWTAYFLFEVSRYDMKRAKQVFFRGLTNLPWAKWFIMLAFEHLDGYLSFEEMRNVWNVLGEKDLRVNVDIQDLLDKLAAKEKASRDLGFEMELGPSMLTQ